MKVYRCEPHSYCEGVIKAFLLAKKAKKENPGKSIYLLGSLVHNEEAIKELTEEGFILLDEREGDLLSLLQSVPESSVLVFSAHGHPSFFDECAKKKKMIVYDATCEKVKKNLETISYFIHAGREVIFLGEPKHLEANAALSIGEKVHLLDPKKMNEFPFEKVKDKAPAFLSQTTMGEEEVRLGGKFVLDHIPATFVIDGRCESTKRRQFALRLAPSESDLIVVLGSKSSNNTMKLVSIAKESHPDARVFRALDLEELQKFNLSHYSYCILASGASTSPKVYDECFHYLESI